VAPETLVAPEIRHNGSGPPPEVQVLRTYEPLFRRLIYSVTRRTTRRGPPLYLDMDDGQTARYEAWPASLEEPRDHPTYWIFREPGGSPFAGSNALSVILGARITRTDHANAGGQLGDPTGTLPLKIGGGGERTRRLDFQADAPVDPEIEFFPMSPHTESELSLREYVKRYIQEVRGDLLQDPETREAADALPDLFFEHYGAYFEGEGIIHAELEVTSASVTPDESARVSVDLHAEREGRMLFALGARWSNEKSEGFAVSDLMLLRFPAITID
jgi:hypothetical protein